MLMTMRSRAEATRALAYVVAAAHDAATTIRTPRCASAIRPSSI
jgi:hypothetical protein